MIDREEQDLNAVLSALGAAEPTPGLQDRVLQKLAQHAADLPIKAGRSVWWFPAFALAAACLAAFALSRPHPHPPPAAVAQVHTTPAKPLGSRTIKPLGAPPSAALSLRVGRATPTSNPEVPTLRIEEKVADRGAAALPSLTPPEAPLTMQEAQLLRIAHRPDKLDLALLNPQVRDQIAHQSSADFERFFPQPTPQEIYLAEHATN